MFYSGINIDIDTHHMLLVHVLMCKTSYRILCNDVNNVNKGRLHNIPMSCGVDASFVPIVVTLS